MNSLIKKMKAWFSRKQHEKQDKSHPPVDRQFTGNAPRYSGAKSAVTGGPPEDINQMPAATDPSHEGPIYDGSDLSKKRSKK